MPNKNTVIKKSRRLRKNKNFLLYDPRNDKPNFLKYWKVVRYWAMKKYGISQKDLETILYFYDEGVFTRKEFRLITAMFKWEKNHLRRLVDEGYVTLWRDNEKWVNKARLYTLSYKAKRICSSVYKKLLQEEKIPENKHNNPIYMRKEFTTVRYRRVIELMNRKRDERLQEKE